MTTENLKGGPVIYSQSDAMVTLAEKWLLEYFAAFGPRRPGELEDDFCGEPGLDEAITDVLGRWRECPFYLALARLIDKGLLRWWTVDGGRWRYLVFAAGRCAANSQPSDQLGVLTDEQTPVISCEMAGVKKGRS